MSNKIELFDHSAFKDEARLRFEATRDVIAKENRNFAESLKFNEDWSKDNMDDTPIVSYDTECLDIFVEVKETDYIDLHTPDAFKAESPIFNVVEWVHTSGGRWEPPDCYDRLLKTFDNDIVAAVMHIYHVVCFEWLEQYIYQEVWDRQEALQEMRKESDEETHFMRVTDG